MSSFLNTQPKFSIKPTLDAFSTSLKQDSQNELDNDDLYCLYACVLSELHIESIVHFILHAIISFFFLLMALQVSDGYYFFATMTLTFKEINFFFFSVHDKTILTSKKILFRLIMLEIVRIIRRIEDIYWISKVIMHHACAMSVFGTPLLFCSWLQDASDSSAESQCADFEWSTSLECICFVIVRNLSYSYLFERLKSIMLFAVIREELDKEIA